MSVRRFIEMDFPIGPVSEASVREKNIRHGHISTLHIWWARRPLAASRASIYAALIPEAEEEEARILKNQFIERLCQWENSLNPRIIGKARREIREANGGRPPRVLDCFAGGGAIPLEALRLGCETHALELNPVAVLILKATLEYPQRYGRQIAMTNDQIPKAQEQRGLPGVSREENRLVADVRHWGEWVLEEARRELAEFYPPEPDGSIPVGYIWARTVRCQNPACGAEIPLMRQFWLAKKKKKKVALRPVVDREHKRVHFEVVNLESRSHASGSGSVAPALQSFDPSQGTICRAKVTCPVCGAGMDPKTLRREFREGRAGQRMVAVVLHHPNRTGKTYRLATEADMEVFRRAEAALESFLESRSRASEGGGSMASAVQNLSPVPDEPLPRERMRGFSGFRVLLYGMTMWGNLFNESEEVLRTAIADGVRRCFFGLKIGEQIYFDEGIHPALAGDEAQVVRKEIADRRKEEQRAQEQEEEREGYEVEGEKKEEVITHEEAEGHLVKIIACIPWDKLSEFVSGVLLPLRSAGAEVALKVELTAQSRKPIGPGVLDLKVRETLQQIGAEIEEFKPS